VIGLGTATSAVVSSADEPPGRSDLGRRTTFPLQVRATEDPAEAGRGHRWGSPQVRAHDLTLPRPCVVTRSAHPGGERVSAIGTRYQLRCTMALSERSQRGHALPEVPYRVHMGRSQPPGGFGCEHVRSASGAAPVAGLQTGHAARSRRHGLDGDRATRTIGRVAVRSVDGSCRSCQAAFDGFLAMPPC
jgi:hypothetical protein